MKIEFKGGPIDGSVETSKASVYLLPLHRYFPPLSGDMTKEPWYRYTKQIDTTKENIVWYQFDKMESA